MDTVNEFAIWSRNASNQKFPHYVELLEWDGKLYMRDNLAENKTSPVDIKKEAADNAKAGGDAFDSFPTNKKYVKVVIAHGLLTMQYGNQFRTFVEWTEKPTEVSIKTNVYFSCCGGWNKHRLMCPKENKR